jgi:mono/diheme cytochrome c family protein
MNKKTALKILTMTSIALSVTAFDLAYGPNRQSHEWVLGQGDVGALKSLYGQWQQAYESRGGNANRLRLPLAYSKALSERVTEARGTLKLDLLDGSVSVSIQGLDGDEYDVWLVDNREGEGRSVQPEPGDGVLRLGRLGRSGDRATLEARLDRESLKDFTLDMAVVTVSGKAPEQGIVLAGAPGFLHRLYYGDKPWAVAGIGSLDASALDQSAPFEFLLPKLAHARGEAGRRELESLLGEQIAKGREIFLNETFNGNGRTCATCHRPDNNHTIDPKYIAKLPPDDPLFVAEYDPQLSQLENPKLLREFGLILANADGFDKPGVLRSVPSTLALPTSITVEHCPALHPNPKPGELPPKGEFCEDEDFVHALGWSGDGSPGTGSLREFAVGAVIQHMPKTLARVKGADFRLPRDKELDALEAYMLSLGRQEDIALERMTFTSPEVELGKKLFDTKENKCADGSAQNPTCPPQAPLVLGASANCNGCHANAGANSSTTLANPTRDTGFENLPDQPARLADPDIPVDGGFGQKPRNDCGPTHDQPCYGDGRFNTPPLIEAADTAPFFHNHSAHTIEEAIALYTSDAFNSSPGHLTSSLHDRRVVLNQDQIDAVGLFLRTLNALENIRSSNKLDDQAMRLHGANSKEMVRLAMADTEDAIEVLKEGAFLAYPDALKKLQKAFRLEKLALKVPVGRHALLNQAKRLKREAKALMVVEKG